MRIGKLAVGLAAGYVLGARAGREKYEQIAAAARKVSGGVQAEPGAASPQPDAVSVTAPPAPSVERSTPVATGEQSTLVATGELSTTGATGELSTPSATGELSTPSATGEHSTPSAAGELSTSVAAGDKPRRKRNRRPKAAAGAATPGLTDETPAMSTADLGLDDLPMEAAEADVVEQHMPVVDHSDESASASLPLESDATDAREQRRSS